MKPILWLMTALLVACGGSNGAPGSATMPPAGTDVVAPAPVPVPDPVPAPADSALFTQVQAIVQARCLACHSVTPSMPGYTTAPRGIRFDNAGQIRADARRIYVNVVQLEFMPYGNQTNMTAQERAVVRTWFESEMQ